MMSRHTLHIVSPVAPSRALRPAHDRGDTDAPPAPEVASRSAGRQAAARLPFASQSVGRIQSPRIPCLALAAAALLIVGCNERLRRLPQPPPLAVHTGGTLSPAEQQQLADIRRFAEPHRQLLLERTLTRLETDPRLPAEAGTAALRRTLASFDPKRDFCDQLVQELRPLVLSGPLVPEDSAPERVALAVSIDHAHAAWLEPEARQHYPRPLKLAQAIRDGALAVDAIDPNFLLGTPGGPLFVTAATALEGKGPSAAGRLCLSGRPAASYVIAIIPRRALKTPLRIPTAVDGACRPRFRLAPAEAPTGRTCSGRPEYVTAPLPLSAVETFRLSR